MALLLLTVAAVAVIMGAMALGVILGKRSLRGSCGGAEVFDCDGESLSCGACPNRKAKRETAHPAERLRELPARPD